MWLFRETIGWHWGFGVAGIFMFFGMLQFYFAQNIFGPIGLKPEKKVKEVDEIKFILQCPQLSWIEF